MKIDKPIKDIKDTEEVASKSGEVKETKGKKRKANSRTPTPISLVPNNTESISVVINTPPISDTNVVASTTVTEKKDIVSNSDNFEKVKKVIENR